MKLTGAPSGCARATKDWSLAEGCWVAELGCVATAECFSEGNRGEKRLEGATSHMFRFSEEESTTSPRAAHVQTTAKSRVLSLCFLYCEAIRSAVHKGILFQLFLQSKPSCSGAAENKVKNASSPPLFLH